MDSDTDGSSARPPRPPTRSLPSRRAKVKQPARETRATAAYFTTSTSTQGSSTEPDHKSNNKAGTSTRVLRSNSSSAKSVKRRRIQPPVRQRPGSHLEGVSEALAFVSADARLMTSDDVLSEEIPPWHTLPYHVWLCVFSFIAAPLRDAEANFHVQWRAIRSLLAAAQSCRAMAEPALAALYKCPPVMDIWKRRRSPTFLRFIRTLALPPSQSFIRYYPKVETLRVEAELFGRKLLGGTQVELRDLLKLLPRLACLELYHPADGPPYRIHDGSRNKLYSRRYLLEGLGQFPDDNLSASETTTPVALRSWCWNARYETKSLTLGELAGLHALPSFRNLRELKFLNYDLPSAKLAPRARERQEAKDRDLEAITQLVECVSALPYLEHLRFESCDLVNGLLLQGLPKSLTRLELINCLAITSDDMTTFLVSHGGSLVELTIKYCQSLSLGFLTVLGTSCPNLAHLEVDLTYYARPPLYDYKPAYARLLTVDQVPTWPSSIQSIKIVYMRNWTRQAAEMFFDSLMSNARALPNLRRLEFKVILDIAWRQRQELRQSLVDQMTRIFKRKSLPPQELTSLRRHIDTKSQDVGRADPSERATRRSSRIAEQSMLSPKEAVSHNTGGKTKPGRRSLKPSQSSPRFDADDEDSSEDDVVMLYDICRRKGRATTAKARDGQHDEFIQGLCDIVDIQVDNRRPSETQFGMDDFVDPDVSFDPEWDIEHADDFLDFL